MGLAYKCDGCGKITADENQVDPDDWSFRADILTIRGYSNDGEETTASWHACSWDCVLTVAFKHADVSGSLRS